MHRFDYSFLNNGLLPANLVNLTASIASLKTMAGVRRESNIKVFTELETIAKVQSVKSSNAIEGIVTSDSRIAEIVNGNSAPLNHNEMEIAGYRDALNAIHRGYAYLDFRQVDILRLHEMLMSMTGDEYGGKYKVSDNYILEEDSKGNRRIRFMPTPAAETPAAGEGFRSYGAPPYRMDPVMCSITGTVMPDSRPRIRLAAANSARDSTSSSGSRTRLWAGKSCPGKKARHSGGNR